MHSFFLVRVAFFFCSRRVCGISDTWERRLLPCQPGAPVSRIEADQARWCSLLLATTLAIRSTIQRQHCGEARGREGRSSLSSSEARPSLCQSSPSLSPLSKFSPREPLN